MNKEAIFEKELNYIKNVNIKESAKTMINLLPDYFFSVEAASTGKYHPEYAQGKGGLVRHTKAAVRFAYELLENDVIGNKYKSDEKDLMIMGLILHDGLKKDLNEEKYTRFDHPLLISNYLKENSPSLALTTEQLDLVTSVVETHMGNWTTDYNGNEVLQRPTTKYQKFVHMCDYLASRKAFLLKFDEDNNIIAI